MFVCMYVHMYDSLEPSTSLPSVISCKSSSPGSGGFRFRFSSNTERSSKVINPEDDLL